jgi:hypothetical protein
MQLLRSIAELDYALLLVEERTSHHWIIGRAGCRTPAVHRHIFVCQAT